MVKMPNDLTYSFNTSTSFPTGTTKYILLHNISFRPGETFKKIKTVCLLI